MKLAPSFVFAFFFVGCAGSNAALESGASPLPLTSPGASNDALPPADSLKIIPISTDTWSTNVKAKIDPICDMTSGVGDDAKKMEPFEAELKAWAAQRAKEVVKEAAQAEAVREHKGVSVGGNAKINVNTFNLDCGGTPHMEINGQSYPGELVFVALDRATPQKSILVEVLSMKSGLIAAARLTYNADSAFGFAASSDIHTYLQAQAGEPMVVVNPPRFETFIVPNGGSSGLYFVAPFRATTFGDYSIGANKFVVQDK